jgi:hypothetical protein
MHLVNTLLMKILGHSPASSLRDRERHFAFQTAQEVRALREQMRSETPENCALYGFKVYSQFDEDGVIERIFSLIGEGSKTFIEIGCSNGLENNTHYLLLKGWKGHWIDASQALTEGIRRSLGGLTFSRLAVTQAFVDVENAARLVKTAVAAFSGERVDFVSVDIDGNDVPVLVEVAAACNPRVICVEYNAKFPPPLRVAMPYDPKNRWSGDDFHGGSLQAFVDVLSDRYRLIACNLSGANAFFCNLDESDVFAHYDVAKLYQPARYHLIPLASGHPPSLKWLATQLQK